jgi:HEAT repeat protein
MLANAFEALKTYDWGTDMAALAPIEDAVSASRSGDTAAQDIENRLIAALNENLSRDARDYVCRKLAIVGTAAAVPVLAVMLSDKDQSHMSRYALERMPTPQADKALRDALDKLNGSLKIGVIGSLGARRDQKAVRQLGGLLDDDDAAVARAAVMSLGAIGTTEAVALLQARLKGAKENQDAVIDALLTCAEGLLASGNATDATAIFQPLADGKHGRLVRLAATRGLVACADTAM